MLGLVYREIKQSLIDMDRMFKMMDVEPEVVDGPGALDTHTEKEIQESLNEISRNRTTLIMAHRLSTVVNADEIIALDQGRIIERGRHAQLLEATMWNRQLEAAKAEETLALAEDY